MPYLQETEEQRIIRQALEFQQAQGMRGPTGLQAPEEAGAIEGDFADYAFPIRGGMRMGAKASTEAYKAAKLARYNAELAARTQDMVAKGVAKDVAEQYAKQDMDVLAREATEKFHTALAQSGAIKTGPAVTKNSYQVFKAAGDGSTIPVDISKTAATKVRKILEAEDNNEK